MVRGAAGRRFFTPAGSHWLVGGAGLLPGLLDFLLCAVAEAVSVFAAGLLRCFLRAHDPLPPARIGA